MSTITGGAASTLGFCVMAGGSSDVLQHPRLSNHPTLNHTTVGVVRIELTCCPRPKRGGQPLAHTPFNRSFGIYNISTGESFSLTMTVGTQPS